MDERRYHRDETSWDHTATSEADQHKAGHDLSKEDGNSLTTRVVIQAVKGGREGRPPMCGTTLGFGGSNPLLPTWACWCSGVSSCNELEYVAVRLCKVARIQASV